MRSIKQFFAVLALLCATQVHAEVVAGRDYKVMNPPQPVSSGSKVEVLEFFFYGCSHCYHLYPLIEAWEKKKPKDVELQYVPAVSNDRKSSFRRQGMQGAPWQPMRPGQA